ncbi:hypothetical protein B0T19DRAFT_420246 [Cercophora scortea]|uniref:Protein kinase domain-containing protein n=1 Tax=Cercophora scortea TaxID=314031 RepID=A0AAE0MJP6_9PEZI|nr:hypothetical protein B0T19DRAFT_420246 [Cercophora scortea]
MWMVTEYCAGGSVATLMRPTGGLPEKWIIPILREVAEALFWVHGQGIIHRDLKCANILITENGGVRLCDFGVAGIIETKFDKRKTVTGTLQWMAPELFESTVSYGIAVDIWAFGSMAYEVASGLPPNTTSMASMDLTQFGSYLKQHCPRLEGSQFSSGLKDIVAYCLVGDPAQRPTISDVQRHRYIFNTEAKYSTSSLSKLVHAYRLWELQGGVRKSLFSAGGAQGHHGTVSPDSGASSDDEWDFNLPDGADQLAFDAQDAQVVLETYGPNVDFPVPAPNSQPQPRRRRPPPNMRQLVTPLEKAFDPNTMTNYHENIHTFYGRTLSLGNVSPRESSEQNTVRESLIDLDSSLDGGRLSQFADAGTVQQSLINLDASFEGSHLFHFADSFPNSRESLIDLDASLDGSRLSRFVDSGTLRAPPRSSSSDEQLALDNRRTLEWSFPSDAMPASPAEPAIQMPDEIEHRHGFQPAADHDHASGRDFTHLHANRDSIASLIDLDDSLDFIRPSTGYSNAMSESDRFKTGSEANFRLQRQFGESQLTTREPSIYIPADFPSAEDAQSIYEQGILESTLPMRAQTWDARRAATPQFELSPPHVLENDNAQVEMSRDVVKARRAPLQPLPPSGAVMQGDSSVEEVREELHRLMASLGEHLQYTRDSITRNASGSKSQGYKSIEGRRGQTRRLEG